MTLKRRDFLQNGLLVTGAILSSLSVPHLVHGQEGKKKAKVDKPTVALIGCGSRGYANADEFAHLGRIVGVCDVDRDHIVGIMKNKWICPDPDKITATNEYRQLLDRKDVDIVSISTVDHWHVKIAAEALLAGKHVFCEKPLSLTIGENILIRKIASQTKKQIVVGTQQRSMRDQFMTATLMVRAGLLGKIQKVTVYLIPGPKAGNFTKQPVPEHLDWNRWQGQTPNVDYIQKRCHRSFRYWYEYGGGQFTDWGAHHIDCAQWALGEDHLGCGPVEVDGTDVVHNVPMDSNGYPTNDLTFNTPVMFQIKCRFASGVLMDIVSSEQNGILFEGSEGRIFVNRGKLTGKPIEDGLVQRFTNEDFMKLNHNKPVESNKVNFLRTIREGGLPASDVFSHVIAMNTCHLCGIASRLKRKIQWNPQSETIVGDEQANAFLAREARKGFELPNG